MKKFFLFVVFLLLSQTVAMSVTERHSYLKNQNVIADYIDMARLYTTSANYDKALEYIETVEKLSPDNPEILYEKAVIMKNYNKPLLARQLIKEAANIDAKYKETYLYKEFFKDDVQGYYQPKDYDALYYKQKGLECYKLGKVDKAINYYKKSLEVNKNAEVLNLLALAYNKEKLYDLEKKCLEDALAQNYKYFDTYINFAKYYDEVKYDEKKQIYYLKSAIKLNPKSPTPYFMLGYIYLKNDKFEDATEIYKKVLSFDSAFLSQNKELADKTITLLNEKLNNYPDEKLLEELKNSILLYTDSEGK